MTTVEPDQSESEDSMRLEGAQNGRVLPQEAIPNWSPAAERVAEFTDYSISSSVVPRNRGGCGLMYVVCRLYTIVNSLINTCTCTYMYM